MNEQFFTLRLIYEAMKPKKGLNGFSRPIGFHVFKKKEGSRYVVIWATIPILPQFS